jgi:DNA invertase Pin-like site-specific DNA recombinase
MWNGLQSAPIPRCSVATAGVALSLLAQRDASCVPFSLVVEPNPRFDRSTCSCDPAICLCNISKWHTLDFLRYSKGPPSVKQAIAYIRVSSREQGQSGFGLASQKAEIEGFAEAAGYRIVHVYSEVASAVGGSSVKKRPVLRKAIAHAKGKDWSLIISRLDRLSRNADEIERLAMASGVKIVSARIIGDTGHVTIQTEAARIQKETEMLRARTRAGIDRARQQGKTFGNKVNLPEAQRLGVQTNQKLAQARRQELEPLISKLRAKGATTGTQIARLLNARGLRTPRGKPWTDANIRRVLRDMVRIPGKATTLSGAWRPRDPVDDDQGGARA